MDSLRKLIAPPHVPIAPGSLVDRKSIFRILRVIALCVAPRDCGTISRSLSEQILSCPRFHSITSEPGAGVTLINASGQGIDPITHLPVDLASDKSHKAQPQRRLILLSPVVKSIDDLSDESRALIASVHAEPREYDLLFDYSYFSADDVLQAVLPSDIECGTSHEQIGHIAHVNLRDHLLPYKLAIGQVILDKSPKIRTVVNKLNTIDTTFRFFQMEVLAGEEKTVTEVSEQKCLFRFDYAKVYWNSRLQTEHGRIIDLIPSRSTILDLTAGVGPFSIPLKRNKKCTVHANDLNPHAFECLAQNAALNKVKLDSVSCADARAFLRNSVRKQKIKPDYVIINLPAIALEFLDALIALYTDIADQNATTAPTVVAYCFTTALPGQPAIDDVRARVQNAIQATITDFSVFDVRTVSTGKRMMRIIFRPPMECLFASLDKAIVLEEEGQASGVSASSVAESGSSVAKKRASDEPDQSDEKRPKM